MINTLLVGLEREINIAHIIRTNCVLAGKKSKLYIFDPYYLTIEKEKIINCFSAGAANLKQFSYIKDLDKFLNKYQGRKISTSISTISTPLQKFKFHEKDLLLFGNEKSGLSPEIISSCDTSIVIPMIGQNFENDPSNTINQAKVHKLPSLNVSIAHAIILFYALNSLNYFRSWK